ncbi:MAG: hypothetical protein ACI31G_04080 [Bacilli bacterium]
MNKNKSKSLFVLSLVALLASCSKGTSTYTIPATAKYGMAGKTARTIYRAALATSVGNLNYLNTQEAAQARHFANFIDGLLIHDEFGVLQKNLAERVTHNENFTSFEFTVKTGVPWVTYTGEQYSATVNGQKTPQYVSAEDWLTTAKAILDASNASTLAYLVKSFVKGAEEYYQYSVIKYKAAQGISEYIKIESNPTKFAERINLLISQENPTIYKLGKYDVNPVTADDIESIANGSRLGIKVDGVTSTGGGKVTYELYSSSSWFPTLFTYSSYLPTNSYFLAETKFSQFGSNKDKLLYNGPYLLDTVDEYNVVYKKNPKYFNPSIVCVDEVRYQVLSASIDSDYLRKEFEADRLDGFGLSSSDMTGWRKYIIGNDEENPGTMYDPADPRVNARLLDTIGSMYGSNVVLARDKTNTTTSYSTKGSINSVINTARALQIKEVREAVLHAIDYDVYNTRYCGTNTDPESDEGQLLMNQYMVHTYTPKGFVIDDNGDDYVTHHLYKEYAKQLGIDDGIAQLEAGESLEGTAAGLLEPAQYATKQLTADEVWELSLKAQAAIEKYNETASAKITYPINIEYFSLWFDEESQIYDKEAIKSMNLRLNNTTTTLETYPIFNVIPTDKINSSNYETVSRNGCWDYAPVQWGWGADYGDPLSYMNTYVKGGDWGDVFPYINLDYVDNYYVDSNGQLVHEDLLERYTAKVAEAAAETLDTNTRFDLFAEAEYMLLNELQIYMPQVNYGQGWSVTLSRAAGYETPTASYGLSNDRLTGLYVLNEVLTRDERNTIRNNQAEAKEEYLAELRAAGKGAMNIYD